MAAISTRRARIAATSPITIRAGDGRSREARSAPIPARVDTTTSCSRPVPLAITATGVAAGLPRATKPAAIYATTDRPM